MRLFLLVLFFCVHHCFAQFPILKGGKWGVINEKGEVINPPKYSYMSNFHKGLAVVKMPDKGFGVINVKDELCIDMVYERIQIFNEKIIKTQKDGIISIYDVNEKKNLFTRLNNCFKLNDSWVLFQKNDGYFLLNLISLKWIKLKGKPQVEKLNYLTIILEFEEMDKQVLFDQNLNSFSAEEIRCYYYRGVKISEMYLDDSLHFINHEMETKWVEISNLVFLSSNCAYGRFADSIHFYQPEGKIASVNADTAAMISPINFLFGLNGKYGILDEKMSKIAPAKYDNIVTNIDPILFTVGIGNKYSLLSNKGVDILKSTYQEIQIDFPFIKAYEGESLTHFILDDYEVVAEKKFDSVVRVASVNQLSFENRGYNFGMAQRSFQESTLQQINLPDIYFSDTVDTRVNLSEPGGGKLRRGVISWGVKLGDSIVLAPKFQKPILMGNTSFSYFRLRDNILIVNHDNYKTYVKAINSVTYNKGEMYIRSYDPFSLNIIKSDNKTEAFSILESGNCYNLGVKIECEEGPMLNTEAMGWTRKAEGDQFLRQLTDLQKKAKNISFSRNLILNKEYNFIDSLGDFLFQESFDDALPFYKKKAIVARGGMYGVVSKDSLIVPMKYSRIKRWRDYGDTLFYVYMNEKKELLYDQDMRELESNGYSIEKNNEHFLQFAKGRTNKIINQKGETLFEGTNYVRFTGNGKFYYRNRGETKLCDNSGKLISSNLPRIEAWLNQHLFLTRKGSKMAVVNYQGDTLSPFTVKKFQVSNHYILLENITNKELYDHQFNLLQTFEYNDKITLDKYSTSFVLSKGNKHKWCNSVNTRGNIKEKGESVYLSNNVLFVWKNDSVEVIIQGEVIATIPTFDYVEEYDDGVRLLMNNHRKSCVGVLNALNELVVLKNNYAAEYLNFGFLKMKLVNRDLIVKERLYQPFRDLEINCSHFIGKFSKEGLIASSNNFMSFYLDTNLSRPFYQVFDDVKPFVKGIAPIKFNGDWTLLKATGEMVSFPSYNEISSCGGKYFKTKTTSKVGLVNQNGVEVIPPIYDRIHKMNDSILQVVDNGKIGYCLITGEMIYPPSR